MRNNPLNYVDPSGMEGVPIGFDPVTFIISAVAGYFISKWLFGKKEGGGQPSLPRGPIQPFPHTSLTPLAGVSFTGASPLAGMSFAPPFTEAEIIALDPPGEPYGFLTDLAGSIEFGLFFSAPMLRALGWAGRIGTGRLVALGEGGAIRIAAGVAKPGTRQIILKAGTELARTFGTVASQTTAEGGFFITQSALRRIGLKLGMSPEALKDALALRPPVNNPATRVGLFRVMRDIPAKIRTIAGGLVNEIVIKKPFRNALKLLKETIVRLK